MIMDNLIKLCCGNNVRLLPDERQSKNLVELIKFLNINTFGSDVDRIKNVSDDYQMNAYVEDLGCIIKNDCKYQVCLDNKYYCFNSKELLDHYTKPEGSENSDRT